MIRTTASPSLACLALALSWLGCAPLAGCGDDADPVPDGAAALDSNVARDSAPIVVGDSSSGGGFAGSVQRACTRIIAGCERAADPMGQPWTATIIPWTQEACETVAHCFEAKTTEKCFERLATYYICLEKIEPFTCDACLNQWQYIQGACPCLKECNPACP